MLSCFDFVFAQEVDLSGFYSSTNSPRELNIKSSERIDSIYNSYLQRKNVVEDDDGRYRKFVYEYNYFLDKLNKSGTVLYDNRISHYLNDLKNKILNNHPRKDDIYVYLTYSSELNAFTNDFGNIYVNVGTIAKLENEAELSLILAHEIAHVLLEHSYKTANRDLHLEEGRNAKKITETDELEIHRFSRENELEADSMAVQLLRNVNMPIPNVEKAFEKLKYAGNPVFGGEVNVNLLFFGNTQSIDYFSSIYNDHKSETIFFSPILEVDSTQEEFDNVDPILYATHPSIESRITQINSILPADSSFMSAPGSTKEFNATKNLAVILYARRLMDEGDYVEALYIAVKARELISDSDDIAKIQLKSMLLITQDKYKPNFMDALINNYGPECNNQDFLRFKKTILTIPALEMNLIMDYVLNGSEEYFGSRFPYVNRMHQYSDQFLYRNNPYLFTIQNGLYQFDSTSYIAIKPITNLKLFYTKDESEVMFDLINSGYSFNHFVEPRASFVLNFMKTFEDYARLNTSITKYKLKRNGFEETLTLDEFIVTFDHKEAYKRYKKGRSSSNKVIHPSASVALVQSDTYFVSQSNGSSTLDIERTVQFDEVISDILNEDRLFSSFYTNRYQNDRISVADNYSHYILNKFIEDCWDLNDLIYSSVDEEIQRLCEDQKIDYVAYNMNFFIGEAHRKRRHGIFYSLYFDVETMGVVYISKIASKQVPSKRLLRHFLFSSYTRNLN